MAAWRTRGGVTKDTKNGFALVVVIWGIGIIALLITSFMTTARWRLQAASNISGAAAAALLAEAATNIGLFDLISEGDPTDLSTQRVTHKGEPRFCSLPGAAAVIVVEEESGKVDINRATPKLLQALFVGFGVDMREADHLAGAVVAFRTAATSNISMSDADYAASGRPFGPKHAPFQTVLELDQVIGVEPELFRAITPFVTIHSRGQGVDPLTAPPALFAALVGFSAEDVQTLASHPFPNGLDRKDPRFPAPFKHVSAGRTFLVHAEVLLPTGQTGLREVIVEPSSTGSGQLTSTELRRGRPRYLDDLRSLLSQGALATLPDC